MTTEEFTALAESKGFSADTRTYAALRDVLVHGKQQAKAADDNQIARPTLCKAMKTIGATRRYTAA